MFGYFKAKRLRQEQAADVLLRRLEEKSTLVVDKNLIADLGVGRKTLYRIIFDLVRRERMFMLADDNDRMVLMTNSEFNRFMLRRSGKAEPPFLVPGLIGEDAGEPLDLRTVSVEVTADEPGLAACFASGQPRLSYTRSDHFTVYCDEDSDMLAGATLGGASREDFWEVPAAALDSTLPSTLYPAMPEPLEKVLFQDNLGVFSRSGRSAAKKTTGCLQPGYSTADTTCLEYRLSGGGGNESELPLNRQNPPSRRREPWTILEEAGQELE